MEWVETTGRDVDEAKERALDQLGVDVSEAEFEVVAAAKGGILGFGRADARVRARVKPRQPRSKTENRRKRQGGRRGGRRGQGDGKGGNGGKSQQGKGQKSKDSRGNGGQGQRSKQNRGKNGSKSAGKESRKDQAAAAPAKGGGQAKGQQKSKDQSKGKEPVVTERMDVEEQTEVATDFVQGLVDGFGMDATASVDVEDETLTVNVAGDELGLLIGPQGATLRAVEELTRTVLQRRADGRKYHRIRVDVGGYKQRRREALEAFTRQLADQVLEDGVARALEPMPAPDRKVVHDTAIEIDGVDTVSEGEDPRRRVVLVPASGD